MKTSISLDKSNSDLIVEEAQIVPYLSEQIVVDLMNSLNITQNQMTHQFHKGYLSRFISFLDGSTQRSQDVVNQRAFKSFEALSLWMLELTRQGSFTNQSITLISNRLTETREYIEILSNVSLQNRELLKNLKRNISSHIDLLHNEVQRLDTKVEAYQRITDVFSGWESGRLYKDYPPLIQAIFVFQDLSRGHEGSLLFANKREVIIDKASLHLKKVTTNTNTSDFLPLVTWAEKFSSTEIPEKTTVIEYLLSRNNNGKLSRFLVEYPNSKSLTSWMKREQNSGHLPTVIRSRLLLEKLMDEIINNPGKG